RAGDRARPRFFGSSSTPCSRNRLSGHRRPASRASGRARSEEAPGDAVPPPAAHAPPRHVPAAPRPPPPARPRAPPRAVGARPHPGPLVLVPVRGDPAQAGAVAARERAASARPPYPRRSARDGRPAEIESRPGPGCAIMRPSGSAAGSFGYLLPLQITTLAPSSARSRECPQQREISPEVFAMAHKLFIGGLAFSTSTDRLREVFAEAGPVESAA